MCLHNVFIYKYRNQYSCIANQTVCLRTGLELLGSHSIIIYQLMIKLQIQNITKK